MSLALGMLALFGGILLVQELSRRAGLWPSIGAYLLVPALLTPYWIRTHEFGWFAWAKLYSVLASVWWLAAVRFTSLGERPWARAVMPALLALNILEAVALDVAASRPANLATACAGLLLVATLPLGSGTVRIDAAGPRRDLHSPGLSRGWLVAFAVWNWTFLYLNFPVIAGHHIAVLGAFLAVGLFDPRRAIQTRMLTLAPDLIALASFRAVLVPPLDTSHWADPTAGLVLAGLALLLALGCVRIRPGW